MLLEHISKLTARGLPPTSQMLRNIVNKAVGHEVGECWVRQFCGRHKDRIKSLYLRGIDNSQKVADNSKHFEHFYQTVGGQFRLLQLNILNYLFVNEYITIAR